MTTPPLTSRRSVLLGGLGAGALCAFGAPGALAQPGPLDYTSPDAFAVAEQAYLALDAQHNEAGLYAWGESYYLLGLLLMYEAHHQESYLEQFVSRVEHVLASTDRARGVTDYAGRSGPVWRASGNYTAGHADLVLSTGEQAIQIRWAGTASADGMVIVRNASGPLFDLELTHPANTREFTGVSLDPASPDYVVTVVNDAFDGAGRWTAADHRPAGSPEGELAEQSVGLTPQFYVFSVHTGMLAYPMARYVRMVRESAELAHRRPFAARVLRSVRDAVRFHDADFVVDDQGRGDFWWPRDAPIPWDGLMQPYNQAHGMGAVYSELYRISGADRYRRRVEAMMASLRSGLSDDDGAVVWPYWQPWEVKYSGYTAEQDLSSYTPWFNGIPVAEDISHAAITLQFIQAVHDAQIEDLTELRAGLGRTFTQNVIRGEGEVWFRVDGTADAAPANAVQSARWLMLDDVEPAIHPHVLAVYEAEPLVPSQGSHALGIAYLNLTA